MITDYKSQVQELGRAQELILGNRFRNFSKMEIRNFALERAQCIRNGKDYAIEMWNSNSLDASLQMQVILQDGLEAYAIQMASLDIFTNVHNSVPLAGKDTIEVSYFPLQTAGSQSFSKATGYNTVEDWTQQKREVSIAGDGNLAISGTNAAAGTARDRKYIGLSFTSYDISRQPYLNAKKLAQQAFNKLGVDVVTDIVSRVITAANFGAPIKTLPMAALTASDIADLRETATGLYWPQEDRSFVIDHLGWTPLLKDAAFKQYLAYGSTDPLHKGRIQEAYGFKDLFEWPNLMANFSPAGEKLSGWIAHKSAALVVTSPLMPAPDVLQLLGRFDILIDPTTGAAVSFRSQGDPVLDQSNQFIECAYGAAVGNAPALKRICQP